MRTRTPGAHGTILVRTATISCVERPLVRTDVQALSVISGEQCGLGLEPGEEDG